MSEGIIAALIAAGASVIGNLIVTSNARKKEAVERARRDQYLDDSLKTINRKLDEHNGYAAKFGDISADIKVLRTEVEHLKEK